MSYYWDTRSEAGAGMDRPTITIAKIGSALFGPSWQSKLSLPDKKGGGILGISFGPQKQRPLIGDENSEGWREIRADQVARRIAGKKAAAERRQTEAKAAAER
jgi:hypothetical protein